MRNLTVKQKRLLTEWYKKNSHLSGLGVFSIELCDEFSSDFLDELREINDTEILHSCIERFISDLAMKDC
jgi:hypothetical protein